MTKMNWVRVQKERAIRKNGFEPLNPSDLAPSPTYFQPGNRNRAQSPGRNAGKGTSRPNAIKIRSKAITPAPTSPPTQPHVRRVVLIEVSPATTTITERDNAKLEAELTAELNATRTANRAVPRRKPRATRHRPKTQPSGTRGGIQETKTPHPGNLTRATVTQQLRNRTHPVAVEYKRSKPPTR